MFVKLPILGGYFSGHPVSSKSVYCSVAAHQETETVKKEYTVLLDAHGCLGVLQLTAGWY